LDKKYDIIIIGSGLGGLLSGVILSKKGFKVLVLEKNHQIGGSLQSFKNNGCNFSTGMHYMGSLDEGQTLNKIFKYFKLFDGIKYKRLDESQFDIFNIGNEEYKFPMGFSNFKQQLQNYFPDNKSDIENYISEILKTINSQNIYLLKNGDENKNENDKYLRLNAWDHIRSITKNPKLQQVLSALNFVYAGVKDKSPFYIHALINNHFISSSYRIVGSTSQIATKLKNQIVNNGGEVIASKEVIKLNIKDNKVNTVETSDKGIYFADNIISDIHPATTMNLIEEGQIKKSFRNRMIRKENTISAFAVHISLKRDSFRYINSNYNYYKRDDVWYASYYSKERWPEHYFLHFTVPPGGSKYSPCIGLLTHMKFEEVEKWKDLPVENRGSEYNDFKNSKAEKLIDLASIKFPKLRNCISGYKVSTPLTYRDYLGSPNGSMYGTLRDCNNPVGSYISPRTKISNLLFTGQNLNLHGILGVSLSAILTCGEFVGINELIKEINTEN
jgi:phytoene dehydrogenase-like protein